MIVATLLLTAQLAAASTDDVLMHAALELAQGSPRAEAHLKQVITEGEDAGRADLVAQAAQLLAIAPLSDAALADGQTRKRHIFAEMALTRGASIFSHADRMQLERVAADGFFDAKDLVRARKYYTAIIQDAQAESDLGAAHYAEYRLAWVDWNEKQPQRAWDRLAALLAGAHRPVKADLRLLIAKDLGRLLLECDPASANERAGTFVALLSDANERTEAAKGFAQSLKRLLTEEELSTAWLWLTALANRGGKEVVQTVMTRSLEVGEPWSRAACATLDRFNGAESLRSAAQGTDWNKVVLACLQKDSSSARAHGLLELARGGMNGILGNAEVSGILITRLMKSKTAADLSDLRVVLENCVQKCWKDPQAEAALWRAWAVALPHPGDESVRGSVDRYLEGTRHASLEAQDWALELALSPPQALSARLMERLRDSSSPGSPGSLEQTAVTAPLRDETARRYLAMRARGEWVIEDSAAHPLPQWLGCTARLDQFLSAGSGVALEDACASLNRDWSWMRERLTSRSLQAFAEPFRFTPRLPGRVERDLKRMRILLREFEQRTWRDARFLSRAREEVRSRVISPWLARLEAVALPAQAGPDVAALKEKLLTSVRSIVAELGGAS